MANKLTKLPTSLIRGDTPLVQFPITVSGSAADLSNYTCTFTITASDSPTSSDVPIIKVPVTGDPTGILNFQLLNGQTLNDTTLLSPGTPYYWDVELKQGAGAGLRRFTPLRGTLEVVTDFNSAL